MKKNVAFIPVRGGSKSIPYKNIKLIAGKPLVIWTIEAALGVGLIDELVISTDSDLIQRTIESYFAELADDNQLKKNYQKLSFHDRSAASATDEASTESVMLEYSRENTFENMILIQATSPLLESSDLEAGIDKYLTGNFDSILSLVRQKRFIWREETSITLTSSYNKKGENKSTTKVIPINYEVDRRPRRQEFDGFLVENGAFYISSRKRILETGDRISGRIGHVEMAEESYYELDEPSDWLIIEGILKDRVRQERAEVFKNKAGKIKLFAMDCDGVLTDAGMYYSDNGVELKKFNTTDGMGIGLLRQVGIKTAIITGEDTKIVANRAAKLKIDNLYQGISNKVEVMEELRAKYNLAYDEIAFIGDDINDIELLKKVGLSLTVANCNQALDGLCDYRTRLAGGTGAVREVIDLILANR